MTFAEKLKNRRKILGYTQSQMGEHIGGIARRTYQDWERGLHTPPKHTVERILATIDPAEAQVLTAAIAFMKPDVKLTEDPDWEFWKEFDEMLSVSETVDNGVRTVAFRYNSEPDDLEAAYAYLDEHGTAKGYIGSKAAIIAIEAKEAADRAAAREREQAKADAAWAERLRVIDEMHAAKVREAEVTKTEEIPAEAPSAVDEPQVIIKHYGSVLPEAKAAKLLEYIASGRVLLYEENLNIHDLSRVIRVYVMVIKGRHEKFYMECPKNYAPEGLVKLKESRKIIGNVGFNWR